MCIYLKTFKLSFKVNLIYIYTRASLVTQMMKNLPAIRETWVRFLGWECPLEESMSTHSSVLAWRIPMDRERSLVGYSPWGHRVGHDWETNNTYIQTYICIYIYTQACVYIHTETNSIYTYMCICVCTHIHIYIFLSYIWELNTRTASYLPLQNCFHWIIQ